jgi:hypothetical protein
LFVSLYDKKDKLMTKAHIFSKAADTKTKTAEEIWAD